MIKRFLDSNVLVYAFDAKDPDKQRVAQDILQSAALQQSAVVSTQVLAETYNVLTIKLRVDPLTAREAIRAAARLEVVDMTPDLVLQAIDCSITDRISIWDAGIVVAAQAAACRELVTEDLNPGQVIRGVRVVNPFRS
jgi:predicted nucleic acid-binding protein